MRSSNTFSESTSDHVIFFSTKNFQNLSITYLGRKPSMFLVNLLSCLISHYPVCLLLQLFYPVHYFWYTPNANKRCISPPPHFCSGHSFCLNSLPVSANKIPAFKIPIFQNPAQMQPSQRQSWLPPQLPQLNYLFLF